MKMGKASANRHFFEHDDEFSESLKRILDGYEKSAKLAEVSARRSAKYGTLESIREAQWCECVTGTIEECLRVLHNADCEFEIPLQPSFDVA